MSTKTTLKRIALVAVSALGFGLLSVSPSQAAVNPATGASQLFVPDFTGATHSGGTNGNYIVNQVAGPLNFVSFTAQTQLDRVLSAAGTIGAVSGVGPYTATLTVASSAKFSVGATITATDGAGSFGAGTMTVAGVPTATTVSISSTATFTAGAVTAITQTPSSQLLNVNVVVTGGTIRTGTSSSALCSAPTSNNNVGGRITSAAYASGAWTTGSDLLGTSVTSANCAATFGTGSTVSSPVKANFTIGTTAAGIITAEVFANEVINGQATSTKLQTFTIIVSAGSSTTYGKTEVDAVSGSAALDAAGTAYLASTAGVKAIGFSANQLSNLGTPLANASSKDVLATITGAGSFSNSVVSQYIAVPAGVWDNQNEAAEELAVYSDGRTGKGTLTVTVGGAVVATQDFVFYSTKVASITAVGIYTIAGSNGKTAGSLNGEAADCSTSTGLPTTPAAITLITSTLTCPGAANQPGIALVFKDAGGNLIPVNPAMVNMTSSDATVIVPGIKHAFVDNGQSLASAGWGYVHTTYASAVGSTSGQKANLTYSYVNTDGSIITSNAVAVTLGGSPATEVLTLDSATYLPGAPFVLTLTAKDSAGNPVYDGYSIPSDLSATRALQGPALPTTGVYVGGKYTLKADKYFVPATVGDFTIKATSSNLAGDTISASGKVVLDSVTQGALDAAADAAAEAIDAANAATDAANLAAEAADAATVAAEEARDAADAATAAVEELASQVATLMAALKAQITTLANTVAKIAKKVKA